MRAPDFTVGSYLHRWWIIPRNRIANIYLHRFDDDDGPTPHDHPWWNVSIILAGSYREHFHDGTYKDRKPGHVVVRHPLVLHRLEILRGPVRTLFLTGPTVRRWGFMTPSGWVYHETFTAEQRFSETETML